MDIEDYKLVCSARMFSGLPDNLMSKIVGNRSVRNYHKGQMIFQQGEDASHFYVVLSGWVKLYRLMPTGEEAILHIFTTGDTFAEAAMFDNKQYPATAEVVSDAKLLAINSNHFKTQLKEYPEIAMRMLAATTLHLKHLVSEIEQIKGRNSLQRVAYFLLKLCPQQSMSSVVKLPYEKNLIATRLGIKPESLSRTLKELRGYGVHCVKNQIVVSEISTLRNLALEEELLD